VVVSGVLWSGLFIGEVYGFHRDRVDRRTCAPQLVHISVR